MANGSFVTIAGVKTYLIQNPEFVKSDYGTAPEPIEVAQVDTSNTFKAGDLVVLSSGTVDNYAADGTAIAGIALQDSTATAADKIKILPIRPGDIYKMSFYHATAGTCQAQDVVIGAKYALANPTLTLTLDDASTIALTKWVIDVADPSSNCRVMVVEKPGGYAATDTYVPVFVKFLTTDGTNFNILQLAP